MWGRSAGQLFGRCWGVRCLAFATVVMFLHGCTLGPLFCVGSFMGCALTALYNLLLTNVTAFVLAVVFLTKLVATRGRAPTVRPRSVLQLALRKRLHRSMARTPLDALLKRDVPILNLEGVLATMCRTGRGPSVRNVCVRTGALANTSPTVLRRVERALVSFGRSKGPVVTCDSGCARKYCCVYDITSRVVLGPRKRLA